MLGLKGARHMRHMQVFKIDDEGYFVVVTHIKQGEQVDFNYVTSPLPQGLYKAKWTGTEWIEGKTEEEFLEEAFLVAINPSMQALAKAERELEVIELLIEMGLI